MPAINASTPGAETVTRLVRPFCNIAGAYGGDTITLDATELKAPAIRAALWTVAEKEAAERESEAARLAAYAGPSDPISRAVDGQLAQAKKAREEAAERARLTAAPVVEG